MLKFFLYVLKLNTKLDIKIFILYDTMVSLIYNILYETMFSLVYIILFKPNKLDTKIKNETPKHKYKNLPHYSLHKKNKYKNLSHYSLQKKKKKNTK